MILGDRISSGWCPVTFTASVVQEVSASTCPSFPLIAAPNVIAEAMNDAAGIMLLSLGAERTAVESERWANDLAECAAALVTNCRHPARVALRLGLNPAEVSSMRDTARRLVTAAGYYAHKASLHKRPGRPETSAAERVWLENMIRIFERAYERPAGTSIDRASGSRTGPAPRFIAAAAAKLSAEHLITHPGTPDPWMELSDPTKIARRMKPKPISSSTSA